MSRWVVVVAVVALGVGGVLVLRHPGADVVCPHAVALHRGLPSQLSEDEAAGLCRRIVEAQEARETPWAFAAQMRCYADARSPESFHDCGGELCHFGE
ncbi:MAG: hypothetical protein JNL21_07355 [Myxococcales bacterium]|nr:hypothetical protein [Myxococcales bacterium]